LINLACLKSVSGAFVNKITSVYNYLTSSDQPLNNDHTIIVWHNGVLLKVNIFVWRLLHNRFLTTTSLIRRKVLQLNTHFCSGGCGSQEDIDHLVFTFSVKFGLKSTIGSIWFQASQLMLRIT